MQARAIAWICWILAFCLAARTAHSRPGPETHVLPLECAEGLMWVQVQPTSGHSPLSFLVDSGAGISVLDLGAARRLETELGPPVRVAAVGSIVEGHGPVPWRATASGISLPAHVLVLDLQALAKRCGRPVDGLLGADFFRDRIVEIDYRCQTLTLRELPPDEVDWSSVPMQQNARGFTVDAWVNDRRVTALRVDTGCASALQWVAPAASPTRMLRTSQVGLSTVSVPHTLAGLRLGEARFDQIGVGIHRTPIFPGESGLLGNGVFAMVGGVILDAPSGRLWLRRNAEAR